MYRRFVFSAALVAIALVAESCAHPHPQPPTQPQARTIGVVVTAYCRGTTTASGVAVARGIAAADPRVFPLGSAVRVSGLPGSYDGTYRVMDTGSAVRGRRLDLYMASCTEARRFGRRAAQATIVRRAI